MTVTPRDAHRLGLSRAGLYRARDEGRVDRIARGLYLPSDAPAADWDWLEAASRRPDATICLSSALAHYDLTDEIPASLDVAIPRGNRRPATRSALRWHLFDRGTFDVERESIPIPGSDMTIGIYSPERSIVDAFRLRGDLGYEVGRDALREWLRRGGQPSQLIGVAEALPRARQPLIEALQVLS